MVRRLVIFLVIAAIFVAFAVWLADRPGAVTMHWHGWRVDTTVPVLLVAIALVMVAIGLIGRLVGALFRAPGRWRAARKAKRLHAGYLALSDGLAAVAVGDRRSARQLAKRADRLLKDHSLTGLLTAHAAELAGDSGDAEKRFQLMLERPETAFIGLQGLLKQALKTGDRNAALNYARRAWSLKPQVEGLAATLFDLQVRAGQWAEAEHTLVEVKRHRSLDASEIAHRQALVLNERARMAEDSGNTSEALKMAQAAVKSDPALTDAVIRLAQLHKASGKVRKANGAIEAGWKAAPHPTLARLWADLGPSGALERVKRLEQLVRLNPDAAAGHLALAEAALAARLWGQARNHLEIVVRTPMPPATAYLLLARLEREEKADEAAAQGWLAKARPGAADPAWVCGSCGGLAEDWAIACPSCGAIDAATWRSPGLGALEPLPKT